MYSTIRRYKSDIQSDLQLEQRDQVYWIRLNRTKQYNAISLELYDRIAKTLQQIAKNDQVKLVVLTGNGPYFSSGNDLKNFSRTDMERTELMKYMVKSCQEFVGTVIDFPKPLIAAVNGPSFGIMFTILGLFDCLIASDRSYFISPFSSLAISPEGCSTYTFPRIFGPSLASELLYFNHQLNVNDAYRLGFVSRIIPTDQWDNHLEQWIYGEQGLVKTCYANSMINAKSLVRNNQIRNELHQANKRECELLLQHFLSDECTVRLQRFSHEINKFKIFKIFVF
ncbi:Enoyl-CoA delta isomerase 2, mitochondrial [Dermatophagoides pteronyssinus]|uniref:Enoyl-CoA delta isomerase 2, mitochondrial n=1 Tax=Dermatophagoides pteronyssinus TaxID=6956 RepID=A0ABQ8IRZ7_DERPT|nr:Enoyl-CoA delta isomerase 2, mitochondrial [Dermatophagoides pteronyssinus]